jgi:pyocin large subunit-like protein
MVGLTERLPALGSALILTILAACDNGPSAVAQAPANEPAPAADRPAPRASVARVDHRNDPVRQVGGKAMWSASRRYSAEDAARRAFERNGEAFGATSLDQFVRKAHAFVESPPQGTLRLKRANGDTAFYDPKSNVFAVTNPDGAPRTMFKPDDGIAYWEAEKTREARRQTARRARTADDNEG